MTNGLPPAQNEPALPNEATLEQSASTLPDDPSQELVPVAEPEAITAPGVPVSWKADRQTWSGKTATLYGVDEFRYRDYVIRADKVVYHQDTAELEIDGHVQVVGGPYDLVLTAAHGDMRLNAHTARFYDVSGTLGVRSAGHSSVYSTANPFIFSARVLLQTGEGSYRIVDGSMTNCRLPKPDWQLLSGSIGVENGEASTRNTYLKLLGVPLFYLPYLRHPTDATGRESGFLIPVVSTGSSIRGYTFGEQVYWVINRSMDMVVGSEYYSKRGWAPNGDFRFKGPGLTSLTARWNALLDRGVEQLQTSGPMAGQTVLINQGGADIVAQGRDDISPETRVAGNVEYLSSYIYRLVFNDNYWQAVSSEVKSDVSATHAHDGFVSSVDMSRIQNFASSTAGDEVRILRIPSLRFDVLDRPLADTPAYWGLESSVGHLVRSEQGFHARNVGRVDVYPHVSLPLVGGGWSLTPEVAARETLYSTSQIPNPGGTPAVDDSTLNRNDVEVSVDLRPPALERDFTLGRWGRELRHVIEPELTYRLVRGIGSQARNVLLVDTSDIATDTNEVGFSLTQRFYLRPTQEQPCASDDPAGCGAHPREWASWQIAQKYYIDPNFGGALISGQRNVLAPTLDLTGIAFLTDPRNLSPVISRVRFEAIENLRMQWDLDYDPRAGRLGANNLFAGYNWGNTTVGVGHSLLNAVDEQGSGAALIKSQQLEPFLQIGKPNAAGLNVAANGGYDFVRGALQYAGVQAVYNRDCCGISLGYRRFALGTLRDETQYLWSITLANFGAVGDIRRSNTIFRDPSMPPAF